MDSGFYHCRCWIPDSLSEELRFRIPGVSGIPDSVLEQYFGFKSPRILDSTSKHFPDITWGDVGVYILVFEPISL